MKKLSEEEIIEIEMLANYPFIDASKSSDGRTVYTGLITVCDNDYDIMVQETSNRTFSVKFPIGLEDVESSFRSQIDEKTPKTILEFLNILKDVIKKHRSSSIPVNNCDKYRHVIREYSELTRFFLDIKSSEVSSNLNSFKFSTVDDRNREHLLTVKINWDGDLQDIFEVVNPDLPLPKDSFKPTKSLSEIYDQFKFFIEKLQPFFELMETLDELCWVLDPVPPQRNCKYRRISIGENISMILTLDPLNVTLIPDVKFLGPEKIAETFRNTVNENLVNWDSNNDIIIELLHLIGLKEFPSRQNVDTSDSDVLVNTGDCAICFSQRLNDKLPEVICKNGFCQSYYHAECLYEWLMSINSRRVFKEVMGNCPNCEKTIACPIPN